MMLSSRPLRDARRVARQATLGLCALAGWVAPAHADDDPDVEGAAAAHAQSRFEHRPPRHDYRLALGTGLLFELASQERGLVGFDDDRSIFPSNLSLAFGSQLTPTWSAGLRMARSSGTYSSYDVYDLVLWQLAAEARWQPEGELGPYALLSPGAVASVERSGEHSIWEWAPAASAALGFDVALAGPVAIGVELRALLALFRSEGRWFTAEGRLDGTAQGPSSWLALNVIATLGLGERPSAVQVRR
jgi:hypothetical protein